MKTPICLITGTIALALLSANVANSQDNPISAMQLLPEYEHKPARGIDSVVGKIEKAEGLKIHYEIGRVTPPGTPRLGGSFSDRPKNTPKDKVQWYREQKINGQTIHLAHRKDAVLLVSFPENGVNFSVKIESAAEMAEALLMILTYSKPDEDPTEE